MYFIKFHKKAGDSVAEYALILGIVTLAFIGMNTYIKRGFQGRMQQMSDKFISNQQAQEMDPTTVSSSSSKTMTPKNEIARQLLEGGAIRTAISDETRIEIDRHSVTQADPLGGPQEAVQGGAVSRPVYGEADTQGKAASAAVAAAGEAEYYKKQAEEKNGNAQ